MNAAALLWDTGAILDCLVATAPGHRAFREAIDRSRTRYASGLALAEVDHFLRKERQAMGVLTSRPLPGRVRVRRSHDRDPEPA